MAAPRATTTAALRTLTRAPTLARQLHMTGPATYASFTLAKERSVLNLPQDLAELRAECRSRKVETAGSKAELIARLSAHELANSRAFSTAVERSQRPTAAASDAPKKPARHFNTSRTLKAVNDNSTIDFAFLPNFAQESRDEFGQVRVPIIPDNYSPLRSSAHAEQVEPVVMKPQINAISADAVYLPMAENCDSHSLGIDVYAMADAVAANLRRMQVPVEERAGAMKQIWNELVEDMFGNKKTTVA